MNALILDTETHDLNGLPIEIAHVPCAIQQGTLQLNRDAIFDEYFSVGVPISFGAMAVHHIIEADIADKPHYTTFKLPAGVEYVIGHNVDYDIAAIKKCGSDINVKAICTLALARMVWTDAAHNLSALYYMLAGGTDLTRRELRNAHNAKADILFTAFILEAIIQKTGVWSLPELHKLSEEARIPTVITFGKHKGTAIKDLPSDYVQWLLRQPDLDPYLHKALTGAK